MKVAVQPFVPDVSLWDAWRPERVTSALTGVEAPWGVAGGWAIDLFLGKQHREHEDLEIAVPSDRFAEVAGAFPELEFFVITGPREAMPLADAHERLERSHQTWAREPATGLWRLDVLREPSDGDTWIFRRDPRIRVPYDRLIERTSDAIPYCCPEIVLLFKAKHGHEAKHRHDFEAVLPSLEPTRRGWLADALELAHPGHPWILELEGAAA